MIKLKLILTIFTSDCSFDWQRTKIIDSANDKMNNIVLNIGGKINSTLLNSIETTALLEKTVEFPKNDVQTARKILKEEFGQLLIIKYC